MTYDDLADETPAHLRSQVTSRGFVRLPSLLASYGDRPCGGSVQVYESSAAEGPHVWLRVDEPVDRNDPTSATRESVIHLTVATALQLADQLRQLALRHYQNDDT